MIEVTLLRVTLRLRVLIRRVASVVIHENNTHGLLCFQRADHTGLARFRGTRLLLLLIEAVMPLASAQSEQVHNQAVWPAV